MYENEKQYHIQVAPGEVGEYVILPGAPERAEKIAERFENPRSLEDYLRGIRGEDRVVLTQEDAMEETLMLSTRMVCGLDLSQWKKQFDFDFEKRYSVKLEKLKKLALIEVRDGFLRLTEKGLELQNAVVVELME